MPIGNIFLTFILEQNKINYQTAWIYDDHFLLAIQSRWAYKQKNWFNESESLSSLTKKRNNKILAKS